ncbi:rabankyrin-5 [Sitophilus oryzae]|uniref:Rabankyrin-5 n=1 Tax=Sitophilus oryzae TaxID=7048 RepID=A0A6J2Y0U4_SITOR|nr:rabankyrin-5 [Sitophilus oryzae]
MANSEVYKLQQHLSLLKQEYSKLQTKYHNLESRYAYIAATNNDSTENDISNSFASRLVTTISKLYDSSLYSDINIKLLDKTYPAHKIVLTARSKMWDEEFLKDKEELDWSDMDPLVGHAIVLWLYKSEVNHNSDEITLLLIKQAYSFKLDSLLESCEQYLISVVNIRTCVKFYSVAEEIQATSLREYCSGLISTHWDDLNSTDFEHMSGPLLYQMLKNKAQLPLHSAVRLQREDVVFLCLVENSSRLSDIVNIWSQQGDLPLELALKSKNGSIAATLVQHNADINLRDIDGEPLLHRAIKRDDSFGVLFLLESNCDATLSSRTGNDTALHLVAGSPGLEDSVKIAEKLLNKNLNVDCQNKLGFTALHISIQADNSAIFDLLLRQEQINVNLKTVDEHTPLYYALLKYELDVTHYAEVLLARDAQTDPLYSSHACADLLQTLIIQGSTKAAAHLAGHVRNLNHVNVEGETALHLACERGYDELTGTLVKLGANPNLLTNELRQSPLHYAVKNNASECIEALIEHNKMIEEGSNGEESRLLQVNFNLRDIYGDTAISLTLNEGYNDLVPILIKGNADINVRNGKDFTLLHQSIMKEDSKTAIFLLEQGVDINAKTPENETPLQLAIHCRLADVVDALCTKGVDMSAPDRLGNCALWAALNSGQENIANILVRHGADTDCWNDGPEGCKQTLLHRALDENNEEAAVFLIKAGCDLDSPRMPSSDAVGGECGEAGRDGMTPLHLCCSWGLEPVARALIEHRANVNARDAELKTPLHVAIENQNDEIISLLLSVPEIDLTLWDKSGLSPFAAALTSRNHKAAQAIVDKLPSAPEQFDLKGQNFLHVAIKKGDIESAVFLLAVQVDVNSRVQDALLTPPIHLAAKYANETLVRSLILAGARVDDRDSQRRTALHIASEAGNAPAVSALLQNNVDFDAVDVANDNALHIAVREGHLNVVKTLLTESSINAEHVNLKGRNPLHELCYYAKENAAAICEFFLECMPDYPINTPDINGNSPLLLAYMKGNGQLCRVLVKSNACLAVENLDKITIFNYQVASKQLLTRLLDQLNQPAPWTSTENCQECGKGFTMTIRKHHCRHCGRALCNKCSDQEVPIVKFGENKPVRVCQVCFNILKTGTT